MKVVTAEQMRAMDKRAIEEFGIPGVVLMENAGRAVVDVLAREYDPLRGKRVAVVCGSGNNGGDGFVVARYLYLEGALPQIVMAGRAESLKADARVHYDLARRVAIPYAETGGDSELQTACGQADLIVDALLGTGIKEAPRPPYDAAIAAINGAGRPVIAVDLPSGVDSDTGATPGAVVQATHTVTFGYPKLGLFLSPGSDCVGKLHIAPIGFEWERLDIATPYRWMTACEGRRRAFFLKPRKPESNKGDFGHVAVVAGSRGMVGAPALVARAAQRIGAGLVTVLAAACAQPIIAAKLDEQMTLALPDADGAVAEAAFDTIAAFAEKATVLCVGPGLTTAPGTVALVHRLLVEINKPLVLDADGLNALAQQPDIVMRRAQDPRAPLILTPHPGEAARLLGTSVANVQSDRIKAVCKLARRFHAIAVLKGRHTLIADSDGAVAINTSGNPGMATGGTGDALTGTIGGLLAQGLAPGKGIENLDAYCAATIAPQEAAALGVLLHGKAGDLAAARQGEIGLVTGDLIACLPAAIRWLEEGQ